MKRFSKEACILICIFALFISCTSTNNKIRPAVPSLHVSKGGTIDSWPEGGILQEDFLRSEIDSVCYIPLETTQECLIGEISQILKLGDSLLIVDQYVANSMTVFDLKGKYCYKIGDQGRGPGEYHEIGYVYLSNNGKIYVSDRGTGKILVYEKDGRFIREFSLNAGAPQAFVVLKDSILLGSYSGYRANAPYRLVWTNLNVEGDTLHTALPYQTARRYVAGSFLEGQNHEVLFYYPLNDTIFTVTDTSIAPYLAMGIFEKEELHSFVERTQNLDEADYRDALYGSEEITNYVDVMRCENHWVVYSQKGPQTYLSVIDKGRRSYVKSDIDKKQLYIPDNFKTSWQNWIIGYVNAEALDYLNENQRTNFLKSVSKACGAEVMLDSLKESNPIITMYHLKAR